MVKLTKQILNQIHGLAVQNAKQTSCRDQLTMDRRPLTEQEWVAYCWVQAYQAVRSDRGEFDITLDIVDTSSVLD